MFRRTFLASLGLPCSVRAAAAFPVIERAWFGAADREHGHDALGIGRYPGRVHAIVDTSGLRREVYLELPAEAAFEDGLIRLTDLDADGASEIVLVVASRATGAAVVVLAVEERGGALALVERARGPSVGRGRWLNPVGMADFRGDGQQNVVAVATPHIGGVLTLYRYQQPLLMPVAHERDVCNHVYGELEQQLAVVTTRKGRRCVAIPSQNRNRLRFLAPTASGGWQSVDQDAVFADPIRRVREVDGRRLQVDSGTKSRLLP